MTLRIDSITRTSSVVPFTDPIVVDIAYSGGTGAVTLSGAGGPASGGSSGTFTGITIPSAAGYPSTWGGAPGLISTSGLFGDITVTDSGFATDTVFATPWPMIPSLTPSSVSGNTYSWAGYYYDSLGLMGGSDVATPYDWWMDSPSGNASLTRQASNTLWVFGIPYTSLAWNFGDGATSTATSPTHTYTASGTYNVTLLPDYFPVPLPPGSPWFGNYHPSEIYIYLYGGFFGPIVITSAGWYLGQIAMSA